MSRLQYLLPRAAAIPLGIMVNAMLAASASAHVKWFCAYDVAGQPDGLENVLCPDFESIDRPFRSCADDRRADRGQRRWAWP